MDFVAPTTAKAMTLWSIRSFFHTPSLSLTRTSICTHTQTNALTHTDTRQARASIHVAVAFFFFFFANKATGLERNHHLVEVAPSRVCVCDLSWWISRIYVYYIYIYIKERDKKNTSQKFGKDLTAKKQNEQTHTRTLIIFIGNLYRYIYIIFFLYKLRY